MLSRRRQQGGFTIIGLLIALAIVGILSQQYFSTDTPDGKIWVETTIDKARNAAAAVNLRSAQTQYSMWMIDGRLSRQELANRFDGLSTQYGGGGRFFVTPAGQVMSTNRLDTPTFADRLKVPTTR